MKKITLFISVLCLIGSGVFAQKAKQHVTNFERCSSTQAMETLRAKNPAAFDANKLQQEQLIQNWIANNANSQTNKAVVTIPVVVQIWQSTASVPDIRVTQQIARLNADFGRTNTDAGNTPAVFSAVDTEIQFCLATKDPSGNATTGIVRQTPGGSPPSSGGTAMWDPTKYVNLYVYNIGGGTLGFAYLNGMEAVHIDDGAFGNTSGAYNLGRTATHEVGHHFNLSHIWGDANCGNDGVGDTPPQQTANGPCHTHPYKLGVCGGNTTGEMFMNYMDYTNDACMNAFTAGQKTRMQTSLNTVRVALLTSDGCTAVAGDDAGISSITTPTGSVCNGTITPVVVIRNYGGNTLTSATINYLVDGAPQTPFAWSGSLASAATATVNLPNISVGNGVHTFDANTTLPNGVADINSSNDAATQNNFTVISSGATLPYIEGFEGSYLPTGMTANNNDGATTWAKTTVAAKSGIASAYMDYYNYSTSKGEYDDIITPAVNLTTGSNPQVTFEVAYQLYTDPSGAGPYFSDTLEVLISTNCGATWTSLYRKENTNLTTTTPVFSLASFVPTANQWRQETISLAAYASAPAAMVMFRGIGDYENQLYIDDINIDFGTGLEDFSENMNVNIFPNPATDVINVLFSSIENAEIVVFNLVGEVIYMNKNVLNRINSVDMSKQANGVYFVKVKSGDQIITKKIILVN